MSNDTKQYWLSFGERSNSASSEKQQHDEFPTDLPKGYETQAFEPSRRDFLKLMGFSTTAAILASCDTPVRKAMAYMNRSNQEVAGEASYFASTFKQNAEVIPVLVKVREGRPIKLEGNRSSVVSNGATSARLQASVLDLYNTARLKFPTHKGKEIGTLEQVDNQIKQALQSIQPSEIALVTSSVSSPSTQRSIDVFLSKYKGSKHIQTDAISYAGILKANKTSYGKGYVPFYQFDKAETIVSFSADFLGTWLLPTVFSNQYATQRKVNKGTTQMSHHIHFESVMSLTGSNADKRYTHARGLSSTLLFDLLTLLKGGSDLLTPNPALQSGLKLTAQKLLASKGKSLVVSGSNKVEDQVVINEINQIIGANGTTINWSMPLLSVQGQDEAVDGLIDGLKNGTVKAVILAECNPVYNHPRGGELKTLLEKATLTVGMDTFEHETLSSCEYIVPSHHYLESWNDEQVVTGSFSFVQPAIVNLFKTRQWQESLLRWSGDAILYADFVEKYWITRLGSRVKWKEVQQEGVLHIPSNGSISSTFSPANVNKSSFSPNGSEGLNLVIYQKVAIADGSQAGNPWLQEMPDPVSKATWGNYALISYGKAKEILGIDLTQSRDADTYEVNVNKPVIKIKYKNAEIELPVVIIPGIDDHTVGVALGYGRSAKLGVAADGIGESVSKFLTAQGGTIQYTAYGITIEKTGKTAPVAITQSHHSYEGRTAVVKETTLSNFLADKHFFSKDSEHLKKEYAPKTGQYDKEATLYDFHAKGGIHWGMSVDLNSCIGCGACVVACNAENNVAVVGKEEVLRGHEMHWMRIDRYFSGSPENPEVIHQPMMCQHCDNAPCENVCPVAATTHSSEGMNQMSYNRCVGTRYCANNCPYKVRRFNWADYLGGDSVENNQKGAITAVAYDMNDDLTRMVLNPDVTVRSRGVMEKCSLCAQRLQAAKLKAKKEGVPLEDDVETACMQACPTHAIVFGNIKNEKTRIAEARTNERTYSVLEQIHTLPNVTYLGKVRNV